MKNKGLVLRTLIVLMLWTVVSIGCEQPIDEDEWIFVNIFYDASGKIKIINGSSDHNIVEIGVTTNIKKNKNDYEVFETGLTVINGEEKEYTLLSTGYWVYIKDDEDHYYYTTQITLQYGSTKIITYNGKGITVR